MKKQILIAGLLFLVIAAFLVFKNNVLKKETAVQSQPEVEPQAGTSDQLLIVSTDPDPLEGAVILPTQNIEFKFNKHISVSEFKHRFDPEIEHELDAEYDNKANTTTFKIKFIKPLDLGSGYTIFVLSNTNSVDKKELGKEYTYHFSTIKYRGV